ncbi:hypothetical protein ACQCVP_06515 [Rossellomorea vietnamensis]|uniref:hypothetical protein n=1 Tax=Rossellomorea vietnamensis TaxID=218284 RepID=UPI003CE85B53
MFSREKKALFPFILLRLFDPEGLGAAAGRIKSGSAPGSSDRQMFRREKKVLFLLFSSGYLTPRSWALELDETKAEAPWSAPTGKCSQEKKRRSFLLFS